MHRRAPLVIFAFRVLISRSPGRAVPLSSGTYHLPSGTDADFGRGQADFEGSAARLGGDDWKGPGDRRSGPETGAGTDGRLPAETAPAKEKAEASTLGPHWRFASTSQTPPFRQLPA